MMEIQNGIVFLPDGTLKKRCITIDNGRIREINEEPNLRKGEILDASNCIVSPGFVDIHIHGANGADFCDGSVEQIDCMSEYLIRQGVTSFLGTTMSLGKEQLAKVMKAAAPLVGKSRKGKAVLWGINMEGPYISTKKKGSQKDEYIINPDYSMFKELNENSGNNIRIVDIAPELDTSPEFIAKSRKDCRISLAHTEADYDTAKAAFRAGASHVTHLYNAMSPIHHRNPGVVAAAVEDASFAELICDGVHVHPAMIRLSFQMFGRDRICIVSDSMRACGLKEGVYELGGQTVYVKGDQAVLSDGTLAGSITNVAEGVRRAIRYGVSTEAALQAATLNPAKAAGIEMETGRLMPGNRADIIFLDQKMKVRRVLLEGMLQ